MPEIEETSAQGAEGRPVTDPEGAHASAKIVSDLRDIFKRAGEHSPVGRMQVRYEHPVLVLSMRQSTALEKEQERKRERKKRAQRRLKEGAEDFEQAGKHGCAASGEEALRPSEGVQAAESAPTKTAQIYCSPEYYQGLKKNGEKGLLFQIGRVLDIPGIEDLTILPDIHMGKVFPVGMACNFNARDPRCVVVPELIGFDVNCGVRIWRTNIKRSWLTPKIVKKIIDLAELRIGINNRRKASDMDAKQVIMKGLPYLIERGIATERDACETESGGALPVYESASILSARVLSKVLSQMGTLGEGNHYAEIQSVTEVFDKKTADMLNLSLGDVCVSVHTGSRGVGSVAVSDFLGEYIKKNGLDPHDTVSMPASSEDAREYFNLVNGCSNFAFCNRTVIGHEIFGILHECLSDKMEIPLIMEVVSDSAHNMMRREGAGGESLRVRKGSTRILPYNTRERDRGSVCVVSVGGSMTTGSYILKAGKHAEKAGYATCHGSGRVLSRAECRSTISQEEAEKTISDADVQIKAKKISMVEESSRAYKCIDKVVDYCEESGISQKVCRLCPFATMKG
ncbi:tRNA-splicing ligase RtcB (3'-phosphate/5'-hydroxy nucleic acid ligase) [Nematocida major]|uniref:tRNA-splicing ligase RtcB (3'-phosphate/5'-hydroxy nucleic acid ligase) n=1 Tax=Nematocida major TaxID=1912982 RepID=UPI002007B05D|nr:tRNA-splicing ligase RtcB (3'-phosphate/5'-hydroxy nucleic acid ligase) [Nematocida major]KAH9386030.1 tRNA-splicing ligase RtcB (3'-phosphate/5'-hydroxy nucleic acid ligase) [Nematocida major]